MTQDFAKKKAAPKKARPAKTEKTKKPVKRKTNTRKKSAPAKKAPAWAWLLIGVMVGAFVMFLSNLSKSPPTPKETTNPEPVEQVEEPKPKDSQVRFDFYEILKGHEVEVDDRVIESTPTKSKLLSFLQVASFKQYEEAEKLRARLILLNLPAAIEKTTNSQQQEWHRVVVGPFTSRSKVAKARSILASQQMNSLVLKRKP